jgi:hypothetical protein
MLQHNFSAEKSTHSHSIISWRLNSLAHREFFRGNIPMTVSEYDKNLRLVAINGE